MTLEQIHHQTIAQTLNAVDGHKTKAAQLLGISRPALHDALNRWNPKYETASN